MTNTETLWIDLAIIKIETRIINILTINTETLLINMAVTISGLENRHDCHHHEDLVCIVSTKMETLWKDMDCATKRQITKRRITKRQKLQKVEKQKVKSN
jgi:hypothetical protein